MQTMLGAAEAKLAKGNSKGAIGSLRALTNQVTAFVKPGKLTVQQGQAFTIAAQGAISDLGG